MWEAWTKLSQKNVDHYNDHPTSHKAMIVASLLVALVGLVGIRRLAERDAKNIYI